MPDINNAQHVIPYLNEIHEHYRNSEVRPHPTRRRHARAASAPPAAFELHAHAWGEWGVAPAAARDSRRCPHLPLARRRSTWRGTGT